MKVKNFLAIGAVSALVLPSLTLAASLDDTAAPPVNPACMVKFGNGFVNVAYIKQLFVDREEANKVVITLASTYGSASSTSIVYGTPEEALGVVDKIADNINNCSINAQNKRTMKR